MTAKNKAGIAATHLRLSLKENAYNFLNQSLSHYRKASRNVRHWPFAVLTITQCIELMLKQVLKDIHPLLIFEDIDHPKHTLSIERALTRLEAFGVVLEEKEKINLRRAADYRNRVVHCEVELNKFEWKNVFAQLFEFVHFFHHKHLRRDIHAELMRENWAVEARLISYFKRNFVIYNGVEMHKANPKDIIVAQRITEFCVGRRRYKRFPYGTEPMWLELDKKYFNTPCHDCGVMAGQYHTEGCDFEQCPRCSGQLLGCECNLLFVN